MGRVGADPAPLHAPPSFSTVCIHSHLPLGGFRGRVSLVCFCASSRTTAPLPRWGGGPARQGADWPPDSFPGSPLPSSILLNRHECMKGRCRRSPPPPPPGAPAAPAPLTLPAFTTSIPESSYPLTTLPFRALFQETLFARGMRRVGPRD